MFFSYSGSFNINPPSYMYKKTYLSFRFITSRPLRQIKQGDETIGLNTCTTFQLRNITNITRKSSWIRWSQKLQTTSTSDFSAQICAQFRWMVINHWVKNVVNTSVVLRARVWLNLYCSSNVICLYWEEILFCCSTNKKQSGAKMMCFVLHRTASRLANLRGFVQRN